MEMILGTIAFFVIAIGGPIFSGWVLSIMWAWFLVPLGVPVIGVAEAIGVSLVVRYLTYQRQWKPKEDKPWADTLAEGAGSLFAAPLVALGVGWIVKGFL